MWQAAVELARQHGVYSVVPLLRLDYMGLKKRLGGVPIVRRQGKLTRLSVCVYQAIIRKAHNQREREPR